jgi:hypothetical protein
MHNSLTSTLQVSYFCQICRQYEHVAKEGAKFAIVNGKAVELSQPRSSKTLLRDFDPIFEREKTDKKPDGEKGKKFDKIVEQDSDEDDTSSVASSTSSASSEHDGATSLSATVPTDAPTRRTEGFQSLLDPLKETKVVE